MANDLAVADLARVTTFETKHERYRLI